MKKRMCFVPSPDMDRAQTIAMSVPTNPFFQIVDKSGFSRRVIMSEESLAAVKNAGVSVFDQGPAN